jgi:CDP-paratose 2-epimerase
MSREYTLSDDRIDLSFSKKTGIVQWFHLNQNKDVEKALIDFETMGITHIRTNLSWAAK